MRRATMSTHWLLSPDGALEGLSCGSDATTEHESGIAGLRQAFGFPETFERGLPDRLPTRAPPVSILRQVEDDDGQPRAWLALAGHAHARAFAFPEGVPPPGTPPFAPEVALQGDHTLAVAWDRDGVLVHARGAPDVRRLEAFHACVEAGDLALGGAFTQKTDWHGSARGLVFVRASAIPAPLVAKALADDQRATRLRAAVAELGLEAELKAAGLTWFALSPRWANPDETALQFWLNPTDQRAHAAGWYSVADLREWAQGRGPVMIDQPLRKHQRDLAPELEKLHACIRRAGFETPSLTVVWRDDTRGEVAVEVSYRPSIPHRKPRLDTGRVSLVDLQAQFPAPAARRRKP